MSPRSEKKHLEQDSVHPSSSQLSATRELRATLAMCRHCFDVVIQRLDGSSHDSIEPTSNGVPEFLNDLPDPDIACPLFVTWDKRKQRHGSHSSHPTSASAASNPRRYDLRGCIGSLAPKPLLPAIGEYALLSAFNDHRFRPIQPHELEHLRVAVSLLIHYEPCLDVCDWTVGTHGIVITWQHGGRQYSSTYLPEVAAEQKWNQRTAVESLIRKAGWTQAVNDALLQSIQCIRYQSSKLRLTYDEYVAHGRANGVNPASVEHVTGGAQNGTVETSSNNNCRVS